MKVRLITLPILIYLSLNESLLGIINLAVKLCSIEKPINHDTSISYLFPGNFNTERPFGVSFHFAQSSLYSSGYIVFIFLFLSIMATSFCIEPLIYWMFTAIQEEPVIEPNKRNNASSWKQLLTLTRRSFVNMHRDIGYYWLRMALYVLISISIGFLFFNSGTNRETFLERAKCVCFVYGFMICLSCGGLPFFIEEMKVN